MGVGFWIGIIFDAPFISLLFYGPQSVYILGGVLALGFLIGFVTLFVGVPLSIRDIVRGKRFGQPRLVQGGIIGVLLCGWTVLYYSYWGLNGGIR